MTIPPDVAAAVAAPRDVPSPMIPPLDAYVFRHPGFASGGDSLVCVVDHARLTALLGGLPALDAQFGGHAVFERSQGGTLAGVWGRRECPRLRRRLREAGADVVTHHAVPPGLRLQYRGRLHHPVVPAAPHGSGLPNPLRRAAPSGSPVPPVDPDR